MNQFKGNIISGGEKERQRIILQIYELRRREGILPPPPPILVLVLLRVYRRGSLLTYRMNITYFTKLMPCFRIHHLVNTLKIEISVKNKIISTKLSTGAKKVATEYQHNRKE